MTSNIFFDQRQPHNFFELEDDLKYFENGRRPQIFLKVEADLKYLTKLME